MEDNGDLHVEKCAPGTTGDDVVYLGCLHSIHPSNSNLKYLFAFVSGEYSIYLSNMTLKIQPFCRNSVFVYLEYSYIPIEQSFHGAKAPGTWVTHIQVIH